MNTKFYEEGMGKSILSQVTDGGYWRAILWKAIFGSLKVPTSSSLWLLHFLGCYPALLWWKREKGKRIPWMYFIWEGICWTTPAYSLLAITQSHDPTNLQKQLGNVVWVPRSWNAQHCLYHKRFLELILSLVGCSEEFPEVPHVIPASLM